METLRLAMLTAVVLPTTVAVGTPRQAPGKDAFWSAPSVRLSRLTPVGGFWFAPAVSPDGRWVAVRRQEGTAALDDSPYGPLWLVPAAGGKPQEFGDTSVGFWTSWTGDSRAMVWDTLDLLPEGMGRFRLKPVGGVERSLLPPPPEGVSEFLPAPAPRGTEVAFYSGRGGALGLWLVRPEVAPRQVALFRDFQHSDVLPSPPTWSPDGASIAVLRYQPRKDRVWVYSRDGAKAHPLGAAERSTASATWSPDSARLAYLEEHRQVMVARRDGAGARLLWKGPAGESVVGVSWAPRGSTLIASTQKPVESAPVAYWRLDASTGKAEKLLTTRTDWGGVSWAPDGKSFYFTRRQGRESHVWKAVLPPPVRK